MIPSSSAGDFPLLISENMALILFFVVEQFDRCVPPAVSTHLWLVALIPTFALECDASLCKWDRTDGLV
jgi:hypothetical protein